MESQKAAMAMTRDAPGAASMTLDAGMQNAAVLTPGSEVKLGALFLLLTSTLVCGLATLFFIRAKGGCSTNAGAQPRVLNLMSSFAGGVFLATCLLDLLPTYLFGMNETFQSLGITLHFPLPEFILTMGFFLVLLMEQIVLALNDQSGDPSEERRSLLVDSSFQCYDKDGKGRRGSGREGLHLHTDLSSHSALRAGVLLLSLSLHAVLEGLAGGLAGGLRPHGGAGGVLLALLLHKGLLALSLALKLSQSPLRRVVVATCLLVFSLMSPLGIGLGVALRGPPRQRVACCTLQGLVAGTFLYITCMEVLPHELGGPRARIPRVALLLTGFAVVTAVLFIKL